MWPFLPREGFPYTNFHAMNQDWILGVVKKFQENYSTIQEAIAAGNSELENTYNHLIELLNAWFATHSTEIETELAAAVASFSTQAHAIGVNVVNSIPQDYTALSRSVFAQIMISNEQLITYNYYTKTVT